MVSLSFFVDILEKEKDNPYKVEPIDENQYLKSSSYINTRSDIGQSNEAIKRTGTYKN
jgi:hypothetical protein